MKIKIPKDVEEIIDNIYINGFEAYIVGGCVRDSIIGQKPNDYDITTSAKPNEIMDIFKNEKIIETGIKHGTITLIKNHEEYEITTYRIDGEYKDNRRPEEVEFTKNIIEDLRRRDFTINAIAYNEKIGVVDQFGGIDDIKSKIIKTVGNSDERFNEDALRIIRAVRFSCKLDFSIEEQTLKSIYKNINLIKNVSGERIQEEFNKILISDNVEKIYILYDAGIFKVLGIKDIKIEKDELIKINKSKKELVIRLAEFIYTMGNVSEGEKLIEKLKYSNKIKQQCKSILNFIDKDISLDKICIKKYLNKLGKENLINILYIKKIIMNDFTNSMYIEFLELINEIETKEECYSIDKLAIDGNDLKALGYRGKDIGRKLNQLLEVVIKTPEMNNKLKLIEIIKNA